MKVASGAYVLVGWDILFNCQRLDNSLCLELTQSGKDLTATSWEIRSHKENQAGGRYLITTGISFEAGKKRGERSG